MIACIQIGNSDDKLTQVEWWHYIEDVRAVLQSSPSVEFHFFGTSNGDEPWQNACWVVEIEEIEKPEIKTMIDRLIRVRKKYRQDSVGLSIGPYQEI